MRKVLTLLLLLNLSFSVEATIYLQSPQAEFTGKSISLVCHSEHLSFKPQTLEGEIYWEVVTDVPLLMGIELKGSTCVFWYRPGQELHLQLHRPSPNTPIEVIIEGELSPADKIIQDLHKEFPTLFGGPAAFGTGIPIVKLDEYDSAVEELKEHQADLLDRYEKEYAPRLSPVEREALYYWLSLAPINNWPKLISLSMLTLVPNPEQDVYGLYQSLINPEIIELLNASGALKHSHARLLLWRIFLSDLNAERALPRINEHLTDSSAAYVKTKLFCMVCKKNNNDAQQTTVADSIAAFLSQEQPEAWKNKVEQACYPRKNPFLNKPFRYSFEDLAGSAVQLPQKKVVLIDIWTTWCGPCIRESKYLPGLIEYFEGQAFSVVALSFDEDRVAWENYLAKNPVDYPNYHIGKQAAKMKKELGIQNYPRYLLVDTAGNLVDLHAPPPSEQALKERIAELLKTNSSED